MKALFVAGGRGSRLWPLSTEMEPKQLHSLITDRSLISESIERVLPLIDVGDIWVVTNSRYANDIADHSLNIPRQQIVEEPFGLGTCLAVGLGIIHILHEDPSAVVMVGWADSYIGNQEAFCDALRLANDLVSDVDGVILGVPAKHASTQYGYIEVGGSIAGHEGAFQLHRFEEKPTAERASELLASKDHVWNSGIGIWKAAKLFELIRKHAPRHYAALQRVSESIGTSKETAEMISAFEGLDPIAIDHAIYEKATNLAVMPVDLSWGDVGSWRAIFDIRSRDGNNVTKGPVVTVDSDSCLIYAQNKVVAALGVSDLIIVESDEVILIINKDQTDRLPELQAKAKALSG